MEYNSAIKRNEALTDAATQMNPEIMTNERSQAQKATYMIACIGKVQNKQIRRDRKETGGCQGLGGGGI